MKSGDLIKFGFVYNDCALNYKRAIYIGEAFIHRDDGVTVENHRVQILGERNTTVIDRGLLKHVEVTHAISN